MHGRCSHTMGASQSQDHCRSWNTTRCTDVAAKSYLILTDTSARRTKHSLRISYERIKTSGSLWLHNYNLFNKFYIGMLTKKCPFPRFNSVDQLCRLCKHDMNVTKVASIISTITTSIAYNAQFQNIGRDILYRILQDVNGDKYYRGILNE